MAALISGLIDASALHADSCSHIGKKDLVREAGMQLGSAKLTGAVRNPKAVKIQLSQVGQACGKLFVAGRAEVRTTDNRMDARFPQFVAKMFDRVDQAGMGTAQEDNQALDRLNRESGVVGEVVSDPAVMIAATFYKMRVA